MASHLDKVRDDDSYADILAGWDAGFYEKFTEVLRPSRPGGRVLDMGCGVGQVVAALSREGFEAHGVDVASANIDRARMQSPRCLIYDGRRLPYRNDTFDSVGALNVLEHVEDPEAFVAEAVRVCMPGGRIVLSSPNFLRFLGWNDYHPRMRGLGNKWRNLRALLARRRRMRDEPDKVRFERMQPIIKSPFTPDDDAIVCTNALDMEFALRRLGCSIEVSSCTDRKVSPWVDAILNATPLRYGLFNAFVVARKGTLKDAGSRT
jgi:SAM-dependent methyltransferase